MGKRIAGFITVLLLAAVSIHAQVMPETAFKSYLDNGDTTFKWGLRESYDIGEVKAYTLLLTSQKWRDYVWTHQLTILVPKENKYDGALLFITGVDNKDGEPAWISKDEDGFANHFSTIATKNKAIVAILRQTPNQPFYDGLKEDALISFTLHNYKKDGDYTWPLLFPMVKGAVKAMTAIQEFSKQQLNHPVNRFVLSGASKRGWTSWLTAATDSRVQAIVPMVIDMLNMPVSLEYQVKALGGYSEQIKDYVKLGIPQGSKTESGMAVSTMVDPYAYRTKLTMPKLIIMCTNDEFWVVDNVKNYLKDIPGKNFLHYVPNAGHNLGDGVQAYNAMSDFFGATVANSPYPVCDWTSTVIQKNVKLKIKAKKDELTDVIVWHADSKDTDFRNDKWSSSDLKIANKKSFSVSEPLPASGFHAFYVDLKYKAINGGTYTVSTRVFMTDSKQIL